METNMSCSLLGFEVVAQRLDVIYARVRRDATGNLLHGRVRNAGIIGNLTMLAATRVKTTENELEHGFFAHVAILFHIWNRINGHIWKLFY